ncbi:MAG: DUF2104 family protein [Treponema sp.]|nr:DUF2104 family protein [Treponema sp.]
MKNELKINGFSALADDEIMNIEGGVIAAAFIGACAIWEFNAGLLIFFIGSYVMGLSFSISHYLKIYTPSMNKIHLLILIFGWIVFAISFIYFLKNQRAIRKESTTDKV